ncbi:hypothetical protein [Caballeronia sordidicola]|uniref:hypothetical protein n=1 Tax=Caballeronia sordidicola TaxID=196367 RepID=UPI00126A27FF|nr:hypothetical protein [Caballeronia sordidicola]
MTLPIGDPAAQGTRSSMCTRDKGPISALPSSPDARCAQHKNPPARRSRHRATAIPKPLLLRPELAIYVDFPVH